MGDFVFGMGAFLTPIAVAVLVRRAGLSLPPGYNPRTLELARQWRNEAGPSSAASEITQPMAA